MKLHDTIDVLIGGYLSKDAAEEDYKAVLDCGGHLQGAVVVSKDLEGNLSVDRPTTWSARAPRASVPPGSPLGLFAPPLLAATAIGGALGAGAGKLLHHKTAEKLGEQAGETIPLGGAGLIVIYSKSEAETVEAAVTRAVAEDDRRGRGPPRRGGEGRPGRRAAEDGRSETWPFLQESPMSSKRSPERWSSNTRSPSRPRVAEAMTGVPGSEGVRGGAGRDRIHGSALDQTLLDLPDAVSRPADPDDPARSAKAEDR